MWDLIVRFADLENGCCGYVQIGMSKPIDYEIGLLPNGEQGPSQGPNSPIKNYGGMYMPDGSQPTGYRPGPNRA
jgi:hypothetical protein